MLKRTSLYAAHLAAGAKLIPFAGYEMPVRYTGDAEEHLTVRERAGLFDVSHMGEFLVRGPEALPLLQRVTTNDVSKIAVGKAQYNCLTNVLGGIIDDIIVYRLEAELYMLVVNAANVAKDWDWIRRNNQDSPTAQLEDISERTALLSLSGPEAVAILTQLTALPVVGIPYYAFTRGEVAGIANVLVATTGYTGERTFELYLANGDAPKLWDALLEAGKPHGLQPVGLGARDTLRLEMGYMLYGNDITDETSPLEAGLGWVTKLDKGVAFTGSHYLLQQKAAGLQRRLVAFAVQERGGIPRSGYKIVNQGREVGFVTSGGFSPSLKQGIGMGYVSADLGKVGTELDILIRDRPVRAHIVKAPFLTDTSLSRWPNKNG